MRKNAYVFDFYQHENYARIVEEASLRDGLAWQKLKRFQLLLQLIHKSMEHVSSLKSKQDAVNEEVKEKIAAFEGSLKKIRQHKYSVYRRQGQFWEAKDGKLWKKWEIDEHKKKLRLQAIGDDLVMALQDLNRDFREKFKNIIPIGPISNYNQIVSNAHVVSASNTNTNTNTNTTPSANGSMNASPQNA